MSSDFNYKPKGNPNNDNSTGVGVDDPPKKPIVKTIVPELDTLRRSETISDDQMIQVGKRGIIAVAHATVENMDITSPRIAEVQMNVFKEMAAMGHAGKKIEQEAGQVSDAVQMLHGLFTTLRSDTKTPLSDPKGNFDVDERELDIGSEPEGFGLVPGHTDTGTQNLDPEEFLPEEGEVFDPLDPNNKR